ncbi:expressed unknown protein [Ectocarpus siliculosus]|uniref:Uncharacterized protein n=1 Tax=Ectocarpus siliculosus TaxID=2880 RepID=D7FQI1_ECTSI|nr:expressed unknown protein [Ectocarpus siliculosus]|eukprot:CBJ30576.1 expressed unknown protein [Ectocarpus siliculosus]
MTAEACAVQCADYAYYGTQYYHEALRAAKPTAALAEVPVAASVAPAPIRAAPRASRLRRSTALTPWLPRASSELTFPTPEWSHQAPRGTGRVDELGHATVAFLLCKFGEVRRYWWCRLNTSEKCGGVYFSW